MTGHHSEHDDFWPIADSQHIALIVLHVISILIAAPGNILVATVILQSQSLTEEPAYKFICSLCFADILVSLVAQPLCVAILVMGETFNPTIEQTLFFATWGFCGASAFGVVCVTADRLIYIVYPLHYRTLLTRNRILILLALQWSCGIAFGGIPLLNTSDMFPSAIAAFITLHLMICFLSIAYFKIHRAIANHRKRIQATHKSLGLGQRRQQQASVTILFVVLAFTICWYPHILANFLWHTLHDPSPRTWETLWYWLLALGCWNSMLNVLIYGLKNKTLQKEVKKYLGLPPRCLRSSRSHPITSPTYYDNNNGSSSSPCTTPKRVKNGLVFILPVNNLTIQTDTPDEEFVQSTRVHSITDSLAPAQLQQNCNNEALTSN